MNFDMMAIHGMDIQNLPGLQNTYPEPGLDFNSSGMRSLIFLNEFYTTFYKICQSFAFQHIILQQGQINQLMYNLISS